MTTLTMITVIGCIIWGNLQNNNVDKKVKKEVNKKEVIKKELPEKVTEKEKSIVTKEDYL